MSPPAAASTVCRFCGDSDAFTGASWALVLPKGIDGLNDHYVNQGHARHAYRKRRTEWEWLVEVERRAAGIPAATAQRRLEVIRVIPVRGRELDYDNLVGGAKPLVDALVKSKILVNDSRAGVLAHYRQMGTCMLVRSMAGERAHLAGVRAHYREMETSPLVGNPVPRGSTLVIVTDLVMP